MLWQPRDTQPTPITPKSSKVSFVHMIFLGMTALQALLRNQLQTLLLRDGTTRDAVLPLRTPRTPVHLSAVGLVGVRDWAARLTILSILLVHDSATAGAQAPILQQTQLYSTKTWDCRSIDLPTWIDAARKVLENQKIEVNKVESCNDHKYKIFTVRFKYDPRTQTNQFFYPLYSRMLNANGRNAYSFVDPLDGVIINVQSAGGDRISVDYESFQPQ